MAREFTKVGVIGLGTIGAGIVEVFARNGIDVVAVEVSDEAVEKGRGVLQHSTDRAVSRGKLSAEDQAGLHARVQFTSDIGERITQAALANGLILNNVRPNAVRIVPPLTVTEEELEQGLAILEHVVESDCVGVK